MYPLLLTSTEEEHWDSSVGKSYGRSNTYWNIAFYNTETGESHLLSAGKKMIIYSYSYSEAEPAGETVSVSATDFARYAKAGTAQLDILIYYSVRTDDFNRDGMLDEKDPSYLFISDKAGNNFKQVSPANYHVENWHLVRGTNQILLQGTPDTDNNKQFDEQDVTTPMIYSLRSDGPAKPVFSAPFNSSVKQLLHTQWAQKKL